MILGSAVAVLFVLGMLVLGARSIIADDARFGWRTFSGRVNYQVYYFWNLPDGTRTFYEPGDELRGMARTYVDSGPSGTSYDAGAMRAWICGYLAYVVRELPNPDDGAQLRAQVSYRENLGPDLKHETFSYPPEPGSPCV